MIKNTLGQKPSPGAGEGRQPALGGGCSGALSPQGTVCPHGSSGPSSLRSPRDGLRAPREQRGPGLRSGCARGLQGLPGRLRRAALPAAQRPQQRCRPAGRARGGERSERGPASPARPRKRSALAPCPPPPCIVGRQQQSQDGGQQEADEGNRQRRAGKGRQAGGGGHPSSPPCPSGCGGVVSPAAVWPERPLFLSSVAPGAGATGTGAAGP